MNWKILVAEDDPNTRAALVEILRGESYQVAEAADGMQAKSLFDAQPPDIACLDVMMPGLSGYDLCRHFADHSTKDANPVHHRESGRNRQGCRAGAWRRRLHCETVWRQRSPRQNPRRRTSLLTRTGPIAR